MNLKIVIFLFISLFYSIIFAAYHPVSGWAVEPSIAFLTAFAFSLVVLSLLALLEMVCGLIDPKGRLGSVLLTVLGVVVACVFLWVQLDFFLKTNFGFSLVQIRVGWKKQTVLCIGLLALLWRFVPRAFVGRPLIEKKYLLVPITVLAAFAVWVQASTNVVSSVLKVTTTRARPLNVVILTFDSLEQKYVDFKDAESKKLFPFLGSKAYEFLDSVSSYPNACCTHGATASLYTGLTPVHTKVLYTPARLAGSLVDLNLPALLKTAGYETHSFVSSQWGNPYDLGISESFDFINSKKGPSPSIISYIKSHIAYEGQNSLSSAASLLRKVALPYEHRYRRVFYNEDPEDYNDELFNPERIWDDDATKFKSLVEVLKTHKKPLFAHYQFMGLHGFDYSPKNALSTFQSFDHYIAEVYKTLEATKQLDQTILVINADHGNSWSVQKVPLMIRFPKAEYAGVITTNTQSIDIAPTVVDYLQIDHNIPFPGASLLPTHTLDPLRPITIAAKVIHGQHWGPPNYMIESILVISGESRREVDHKEFKNDKAGNIVF